MADYEFCTVERDDRLLIVTIARPERMNALHPPANEELARVFETRNPLRRPGRHEGELAGEPAKVGGHELDGPSGRLGRPVHPDGEVAEPDVLVGDAVHHVGLDEAPLREPREAPDRRPFDRRHRHLPHGPAQLRGDLAEVGTRCPT